MPAVNDKISKTDYNNIRNKVAKVLGTSLTSDSTYGYGQVVQSTEVTESNRITVNHVANLRYDIINAWVHLNGSAPALVSVVEGDTIRYDLTTAPVSQFDTFANTLTTNRLSSPHSSQRITSNKGTTSTTWPGLYGSAWTTLATCTITVSFSSAEKARHFFNSGSTISFSSSQSGGSGTSQNTSWRNLLASVGTQSWGGNTPGAGVSPGDGQNFYRCTNTLNLWYSASASSPYGSNSYKIYARTPFVANNSTGTANVIEFKIEFVDGHVGLGGGPDSVDGTFTIAAETLEAFGVLQPITAGNFTVESPTVTLGAIIS